MSQASATVCIQVPTREIICPPKKSWKLRCFSARNMPAARPCPAGPGVGAVVDGTSTVVGGESAISREATSYCSAPPVSASSTATLGCAVFVSLHWMNCQVWAFFDRWQLVAPRKSRKPHSQEWLCYLTPPNADGRHPVPCAGGLVYIAVQPESQKDHSGVNIAFLALSAMFEAT